MQMPRSRSPRTSPEVAAREQHRSRWKLGPFTWPIWHGRATADSRTPGASSPINSSLQRPTRQSASSDDESPPPELYAATLRYDCELRDAVLQEARRRLEALEADPETDELTLVMARHEVFMRKRAIAQTLMS
jgi:hypothetical protein